MAAVSADELREVIKSNSEDKGAVLGVASELTSAPEDSLAQLDGDWVVSWSDLGKGWIGRTLMGLFTPSLKMLSFGALPPVKVAIVDSYNRVCCSTERYDLLQVFQIPDSECTAAMVLGGSCRPDPEKPNRLTVKFTTVRVLPAIDAPAECVKALQDAGLADAMAAAIPIDTKETYIDVDYIDDALRVHKGQSGTTYVLDRLQAPAAIPFPLDEA